MLCIKTKQQTSQITLDTNMQKPLLKQSLCRDVLFFFETGEGTKYVGKMSVTQTTYIKK